MADTGTKYTPVNRLAKGSSSKYTPVNRLANLPPKPLTTTQKVLGVGKELVKAVVEPVATMVARPIQLGAELLGASDESVNEFTKKHFGDWVAPTPQNMGDLKKDVGRGIQTALTGGIGGGVTSIVKGGKIIPSALGKLSAEGAGFGLGASMEEGNPILSKETAQNMLLGAGLSVLAPVAIKGVSRIIKNKGRVFDKVITDEAALQSAKERATYTVPEAGTPPLKMLPEGKPVINLPEPGILESQSKLRIPENTISTIPVVGRIPKSPKVKQTQTIKSEIPTVRTEIANRTVERLNQEILVDVTDDIRQYQKTTNQKQVDEVMTHDFAFQKDVALGRKQPPVGGAPATAYRAHLENLADEFANNGDTSLAEELSKTKIVKSEMGAGLQATQIASKDSLTAILSDVRDQMVKKIPRGDVKLSNLTDNLKVKISSTKQVRPTRDILKVILDNIKCR